MIRLRDEFLSEEDLDLQNFSKEELFEYWDQWLEQAQITNEADKDVYSHGVFVLMGSPAPSFAASDSCGDSSPLP